MSSNTTDTSSKKTKKNLTNFISNRDVFGHKFSLNFDKSGTVHRTCFGGSISVVLKVIMLVFILRLLGRMLTAD